MNEINDYDGGIRNDRLVGKIAKKPLEILPILLSFENGLKMEECLPIILRGMEAPPLKQL